MPVRLGAASQQSIRLGAAQVTRMYLGAAQVYSSAPPEPPAPRPDMPAPSNLTAVAANATVTLNWTNGVTATSHVIQQSTDGGSSWSAATAAVSGLTTATVTGLTNGTAYRFRVAAQTALGLTAFSAASASVRPVGPPSVPPSVSVAGSTLSWQQPSDTGGALAQDIVYIIQRGTGSAGEQVWQTHETLVGRTQYALTPSCTTSYWWRVAANTSGGQSSYSSAAQQAAGQGTSPPKDTSNLAWVDADPCANGISVSWNSVADPPSAACDSVSHYEIWIRKRSHAADAACGEFSSFSLAATVPAIEANHQYIYTHDIFNLDANADYRVAVRGINAAGAGPQTCSRNFARPGASTLPPRPTGMWGSASCWMVNVYVPTFVGASSLHYEIIHWTYPIQFGTPYREPERSDQLCITNAFCGAIVDGRQHNVSDYPPLALFDTKATQEHACAMSAYHHIPSRRACGTSLRMRYSYNGQYGPWAFVTLNGCPSDYPAIDLLGPPELYYLRGGKNSVFIQRASVANARMRDVRCEGGPAISEPTDWLLEYRTATRGDDAILRGSGAWIPLSVGSSEGFTAALPTASSLEVRLRGETAWGLGAPSIGYFVRTWASGGAPSSALGATGSMLFDDPSAWTQPVLAAPATNMAAGRYFTVSRTCVVSLSVAIGSTNAGASPASASVAVASASGTHIGYIAHKVRLNATVRLSFLARPSRRYSVEVADTANATSSVTNCYAEDIYSRECFSGSGFWNASKNLGYPQVFAGTDLPSALYASPRFQAAGASEKDMSAAEWFGPSVLQRSFTSDDNDHFFVAQADLRVYYKVTGQWAVYFGTTMQPRQYAAYLGTSPQSTSNHSSFFLRRGERMTIVPNGASTATLNYVYAEMSPQLIVNQAGADFVTEDALGAQSGMLAADKNGL